MAPKDPGTKDTGAKAIDFGTGKASSYPTDYSGRSRPDAEKCYPEYNAFNGDGNPSGLAMDISSKHNGGEKPGKDTGGM